MSRERLVRGSEIIYVDQRADEAYWDQHWHKRGLPSGQSRLSSNAKEFLGITARFLAKGDRVLEGGCGNGEIAVALHEAGFRVTALDWAPNTVQRLQELVPSLEVVVGDVRDLKEFEGAQFDGYWSLGVIEHFWSGYAEILSEAQRVLRPGGWLFLTFPAMNFVRRAKVRLGLFRPWKTKDEPAGFYQFLLDPRRVCAEVEALGFNIVEARRRSGRKGFAEEFWKGAGSASTFARNALGVMMTRLVGHGMIIVAQKPVSGGIPAA